VSQLSHGLPGRESAPEVEVHSIEKEKTVMQGHKSEIDWSTVKRERSAGVRVADLAKKYGITDVTIYAHTRGAMKARVSSNGAPKRRSLSKMIVSRRSDDRPSGRGDLKAILGDLMAQKEMIDKRIAFIEEWIKEA
jgi:hypothetical protein